MESKGKLSKVGFGGSRNGAGRGRLERTPPPPCPTLRRSPWSPVARRRRWPWCSSSGRRSRRPTTWRKPLRSWPAARATAARPRMVVIWASSWCAWGDGAGRKPALHARSCVQKLRSTPGACMTQSSLPSCAARPNAKTVRGRHLLAGSGRAQPAGPHRQRRAHHPAHGVRHESIAVRGWAAKRLRVRRARPSAASARNARRHTATAAAIPTRV